MSESLNQFIDALGDRGQLDSAGVFTVNVEKAGSKIQSYQLVDPHLYVADLVSAAVLGNAKRFNFFPSKLGVEYTFDGQGFEQAELENILSYATIGGSSNKRLKELAVAFGGIKATEASEISFFTKDQSGRDLHLLLNAEGTEVQLSEERSTENRLVIKYPLNLKKLPGLFVEERPELEILRKFCARAPLTIRAGVTMISGTEFRPSEFLAWKMWQGPNHPDPIVPKSHTGYVQVDRWLDDVSAVLCLLNPMFAEVQGLTIVLNGVAFRREAKLLGCPYACGVVYVKHLSKNISHTDLAEDELYEALLSRLRQMVNELWTSAAASPACNPGPMSPRILTYLRSRFRETERPASISQFLIRLELDQKLLDVDRCKNLLEEAGRLEQSGHKGQAQDVRERIASSLTRNMVAHYAGDVSSKMLTYSQLQCDVLQASVSSLLPYAQDTHRILSALAGKDAPVVGQLSRWQAVRACLCQLALGNFERARAIAEDKNLGMPPAWSLFAIAELDRDPDMYYRAAQMGKDSIFLWNQAAAALRLESRFKESFDCRCRAMEYRANSDSLFVHLMAKEASGKLGFATWIKWSVKAQFQAKPAKRIAEVEESLERKQILPKYAFQAAKAFKESSGEYCYLFHRMIWIWRENQVMEYKKTVRAQARYLLRRMLQVNPQGIQIADCVD